MPHKIFLIDDHIKVKIIKKRNNKNIRLALQADGLARVSIPYWTPYAVGLQFAKSKKDWILNNHSNSPLISDGQQIGKNHRLNIVSEDRLSIYSKVLNTEIVIKLPINDDLNDPATQSIISKACVKALRMQAEDLLPKRLEYLSNKHGFKYNSVSVKLLRSRWGSCDHKQNIVLNLYMMLLPWELIDYVLLHELTHTKIMKHGPEFWQSMREILPEVSNIKKELRTYQPNLNKI